MSRPIFYSQHRGHYFVPRSWIRLLVHCEYENKSASDKENTKDMIPSKSSSPPSTYDEPGKPFDVLLKATGCPADSTAVTCLKAVPFEVYFSAL